MNLAKGIDKTKMNKNQTPTINQPPQDSAFYCSPEWHLAQQHGRGADAAAIIYPWALRLVKKNGQFWVSPQRAADYFGLSPQTCDDAYDILETLGFFVLIQSGKDRGESNLYRVLTHKEWAEAHSGQCVQKSEMPWSDEDQALRGDLHNAGACRIPFMPFQITWIKKSGLTDAEILEAFKSWLPTFSAKQKGQAWRKTAAYHFGLHVKRIGQLKAAQLADAAA